MRRKRPVEDPDLQLGPDHSELEDFGDSGGRFFEDAWNDVTDVEGLDAFADDTESVSTREAALGRSLSRRPRLLYVLLALVVLVAGVFVLAASQGRFESAEPTTPSTPPTALLAPGQPRSYEPPGLQSRRQAVALDETFGRLTDDGPLVVAPADVGADLPIGVTANVLVWGGRLHVLLEGPPGFLRGACAVASLVASDLRTLDLAASGTCPDRFATTGDRTACSGERAILLEVWPPSAFATTDATGVAGVPVAAVRARLDFADVGDWAEISLRGAFALAEAELTDLPVLGGQPATVAMLGTSSDEGSCVLRDRADVPVLTL